MLLTPIHQFSLQVRVLLTSWLTVGVFFGAGAVVMSPLGLAHPRWSFPFGIFVTFMGSLLLSRWLCPEVRVEGAANERDSA